MFQKVELLLMEYALYHSDVQTNLMHVYVYVLYCCMFIIVTLALLLLSLLCVKEGLSINILLIIKQNL